MAAPVRGPFRLPLIAALALAFASLALISGVAYIVVLAGATGTAERLLVDRAESVVEKQIEMVKGRLDPVTNQLELMAALMAAGRVDVDSPVNVREALAVMMSRAPAVSVAAFGTLDLQLHRAVRHPDGSITRDTIPLTGLKRGLERFRELQTSHETFWGELFWSESEKQPVLNVRTPVRRIDDAFIGGLVATVAVGNLSALIGDPSRGGDGRYFILVQHDTVLAHRLLIDPRSLNLTEDRQLPTIKELGDPVLARIWDPPVRIPRIDRALGTLGHVVEADGRRWVFVYREVEGYGPKPWLVGQYFPIEDATEDLDRLTNGAIVGAITLAVTLVLAILMGVRMARSIRTITTAAEAMERLEFDQPMSKRSRLREIDDAAHSLDKARGALRWFGAYVPQRLVRRLMEVGEDGIASRRVNLTVMFTDIVEFTPQAEDLPEHETAELLNHHFALLGACIEREHGIIDKYIGDSVMAVWGSLSGSDDHAAAAIRAALEIARVIREDNQMRRAAGKTPIRVRIGLHSGPAVVGNIGAPGRVNFTVVGDTVNVAQRFEQLGKEFMGPDDEIVVLVSGASLAMVKDKCTLGVDLPPPEQHKVKGHDEPVEVYRLV
ncbi:adenylate/guanylate cyclase domain-containing protein [Reyranella sp.]|uniref:adenylate/guanylate cyclase domain-containing protein n=1 Tax=Reyranella sp. TaxID=1929291 RepID=UPI003D1196F6